MTLSSTSNQATTTNVTVSIPLSSNTTKSVVYSVSTNLSNSTTYSNDTELSSASTTGQYTCTSGLIISMDKVCDGIYDCPGTENTNEGEEEEDCSDYSGDYSG